MYRRAPAFTAITIATLLCTSSAMAAPRDTQRGDGSQPLTNDHAYVFTQQQRDNLSWWNGTWLPQTVPSDAHVQVQLPSDPIRWIPDQDGARCQPSLPADLDSSLPPELLNLLPVNVFHLAGDVELYDTSTLPNTGRISGSSELTVFDYHVTGLGVVPICLRPHPEPEDAGDLGFPPDTPPYYVATIIVGVPQVTLP
jgi:hypothetical protein